MAVDMLPSVSQRYRHENISCFNLITSDQSMKLCVCVCVCSVRDGYKVGSDVSVSLEFLTSQSEGVFLGISSAKVDAIGLEMINGQVSRKLPVCVRACVFLMVIDNNLPVFFRWCLT